MSVEERLRGLEQFKELLLNVMDVFPNGIRLKQTTTILNHDPVTLDANADAVLGLTGQQITLDKQGASRVLIAPTSVPPIGDYPTFRKLVADDLPERWYPLTAPLTSTSWDGDSYSTTAKTLIDLSAVFGVPAGVKAVLIRVAVQDSGAASGDYYIVLSPNASSGSGLTVNCIPVNDRLNRASIVVPCDANGDIYYQIVASGANTFDVYLQIWGYYL